MPAKKVGGPIRMRKQPEKHSDEYMAKRERNNEAVKKSREKSRQKQKETSQMVGKLRNENTELERKVKLLTKELDVLKDLFLSHAASIRQDSPASKEELDEQLLYNIKTEQSEYEVQGVPMADQAAIALIDHEYCS